MLIGRMMRAVLSGSERSAEPRAPVASSGPSVPASLPTMISDEYRKMQQQLHENPKYGMASVVYAPMVAQVIETVGAAEMLDYGAGKGRLGDALKQHIQREL